MKSFNYSSYKGGYRKKSAVMRVILLVLLFLLSVFLILFFLLQDYIVFTKDGIRIEFDITAQQQNVRNNNDPPVVVQLPDDIVETTPVTEPDDADITVPPVYDTLRGVVIPLQMLNSSDFYDTLASIPGIDTLVFEVKSEAGLLYYSSSSETARTLEVSGEGNLVDLIKGAKDRGYRCIIRISCFKDRAYASAFYDRCLQTSNNIMWLDRYSAPWINPYKIESFAYLAEIAAEISNAGPDGIILDHAGFPGAGQLSLIDYKGADANYSKNACIRDFLIQMRAAIDPGIPVWVGCDYDALMGGDLTGLKTETLWSKGFGIMPVFTASQSGVLSYPAVERNANLPVDMAVAAEKLTPPSQYKDIPPPLPVLRMYADQPAAALSSRVLPAVKELRKTFSNHNLVMTNNGAYIAALFD